MAPPIQPRLLDALKKVDRPGTFCTSGSLPTVIPGLEIAGHGTVSLPLGKRDAAALKKQAHQAPYGKGTKTLVDTDVRRVWEIDAEQVTLRNPQWAGVVDEAIRTTQSNLGLEKQELAAHLYKLLLYEPGSFFLAHRDGEKLDRMVATLVIALPSTHEGGELLVRHEGQEVCVDFAAKSPFETQFAAFYADCEHEIRPVKSGYRLALVYNLTLEKSKRKVAAPASGEHIAAIGNLLGAWSSQPVASTEDGAPQSKLAVLLDHQYTQAGLTRDALKGIDRARADVLFTAGREAHCDVSLALVTLWESGSAEPTNYDYGRRYHRRYDDEGDDEDEGEGQYEMGELIESTLTAEHFSDAEGNRLAFDWIPLHEEELVAAQPLREGKPSEEDFEGYTGNAGMTLERWYRRAALVIWPANRRFDVLCEAGVHTAVGGLAQMVKQWKQAKKSEQAALRQSCVEFARRIIEHWPEQKYGRLYSRAREVGKDRTSFLAQLEILADRALVSAYVRGVLMRDASVDPGKELGDVCEQHGWSMFAEELRLFFASTSNETLERHAQVLADFALRKDKDKDRQALCLELAGELMTAVERCSLKRPPQEYQASDVNLAQLLPPLVQSFLLLGQPALMERLVEYVLVRPKLFDLLRIQVPVLLELAPWLKRNVKRPSAPLNRWLAAVREALEARAGAPPEEPTDWRRNAETRCECAHCQELSRFLADPAQETMRLPLAQTHRQHLHQIVDSRELDTTHVTERYGRPFTLVFKKTKESYKRALQVHQADLDYLAKIRELIQSLQA